MAQAAVQADLTGASSRVLSRIGGILYLYIIVAAVFGEMYVRDRLIVRGDAAATASNILGSETLFRVSVAGELITCLCDVALAGILYVLFRPVSRNVSLLAAANRLTFAGVYCVSKFFLVAALILLDGSQVYRSGYAPRAIGVLLVIGGAGYLVHSVTQTLSPATAGSLFPWIILPAFPAELGLTLWLLLRRVDSDRR